VSLDRLLAEEQLRGDLGIGLAVDDQPGDLELRAYLPYKVNFGLEVVEAQRPLRILSDAHAAATVPLEPQLGDASRRETAPRVSDGAALVES
jgi:hypothetical protein